MKVLLTGGSGFLGKHLICALLRKNIHCVVLHRTTSIFDPMPENIDDAVVSRQLVFYNLDHLDLDTIFQQEAGIDAIIHAATMYDANPTTIHQLIASNIAMPTQLLALAVAHGVPRFINTDSFFNTPSGSLYSHLAGYTLSKRQFQEWGQYLASQANLYFLNARLFHMYGPHDGDKKFVSTMLKQLLQHDSIQLTAGIQRRDFIYVTDVVDALLLLLTCDLPADYYQTYDIGTGKSTSIREFVELAKSLSNSQSLLEFGALPSRSGEFTDACADLKAINDLGWKTKIPLEIGLKKTLEHLSHIKDI